jgi:hypothetical protein
MTGWNSSTLTSAANVIVFPWNSLINIHPKSENPPCPLFKRGEKLPDILIDICRS